jgi:ABC-type transport system substrate-binding protein
MHLNYFASRRIFLGATLTLAALLSGCGRHQPQASTPELKILYNTEEEPAEKSAVAQVLQAQLGKAGIPVVLDPVSNAVFYERVGAGNFQCALALWYLDYDDPEGFLTDFYSKAGFRLSKYQNPAYDQAYLGGLLAPNSEKKKEGFRSASQILMQDLPWVPLYSNDELFLLSAGTDGFRSNAYQYYDYRRVARGTIRVASNIELQTLDPALVYDLASKHVATQSYEGLVAMDDHLNIVPALAKSWQFSQGNDRLTFDLRTGVKFHGQFGVFSAKDVKASFERMLRQNSPYAYIFDHVKGIEEFKSGKAPQVSGFRVDGPSRFTIELKESFPTMLNWLLAPAAFVLPAGLPAKYDFSHGSAGTGPFALESWDGTVAKFAANQSYWATSEDGGKLPLATSLSIRTMKEVNAMLTAYQQGELDLMNVPLALYGEVLDPKGELSSKYASSRLRVVPLNNLKFLAFRMGTAPWGTDSMLRKKVYDGIDRSSIVTNLFRGKARVALGVVPQMEEKH